MLQINLLQICTHNMYILTLDAVKFADRDIFSYEVGLQISHNFHPNPSY